MARRQFQEPTPFVRGDWWVVQYRSTVFVDGKPVRKNFREKLAPKSKKIREVLKIRDDFIRPFNQGINNARSATTFDEYVRQSYRGTKLPLMAEPSRNRYEGVIDNYLVPAFGKRMLREVTPETVQSYMTGLAAGGELGLESRRKILTVLSSILASAKKYGYLSSNPAEDVDVGRDTAARKQKPYVTPQQFKLLIDMIAEPYATMVFVAVWTGLRVSEVIALRWRNLVYDFEILQAAAERDPQQRLGFTIEAPEQRTGSITIDQRYCRGDWSAPKSAASAATIRVNPEVFARIERLKSMTINVRAGRAVRHVKAVRSSEPDDLIFQPIGRGKVMRDNNILVRHIKPAARKLKLSFVNWRCLRTSHAVWLKLAGADVKDAQAQMRHSRASTTLDIYQQFVPESQKKVVDRLSKLASERIQ